MLNPETHLGVGNVNVTNVLSYSHFAVFLFVNNFKVTHGFLLQKKHVPRAHRAYMEMVDPSKFCKTQKSEPSFHHVI